VVGGVDTVVDVSVVVRDGGNVGVDEAKGGRSVVSSPLLCGGVCGCLGKEKK